jgi:phosphonate transport system substrate-binding protein
LAKPASRKFIPITFKKHWEVIRKIDATTNVSYNCQ